MKPLLAHIYEPHRVTYPCYVQPKLNGIRALYQNGAFQSRDELPFPNGLLSHLARPLLDVFSPDVILDGELYVHGWPLQRINAAVTPVRQHPTEDTVKVEYHVFDVVNFELAFGQRQVILKQALLEVKQMTVKVVPTTFITNEFGLSTQSQADELYASWVAAGYEGMMYRLGDCPYTVPNEPAGLRNQRINERSRFLSDKNNRVWHLLKRKDWQDDDFPIVGMTEGEGKQRGMLGAFICITPGGQRFHVGSGVTDAERVHYWELAPELQPKFLKVKYLVLSQDGIPLNPTILAVL